ncbi:hypothetical protein BDY21DRAFT_374120 [Lineolata rhizophorae]|uniref:Uncharacterized protein n=1 Tax=Lineolata rhizophorae TaxID=578093 RepID=A0A6A6NRW7_9PEZI|nr:hypothetical protein BDY21DRAFT_374120 [Lineolata rhizophorae]
MVQVEYSTETWLRPVQDLQSKLLSHNVEYERGETKRQIFGNVEREQFVLVFKVLKGEAKAYRPDDDGKGTMSNIQLCGSSEMRADVYADPLKQNPADYDAWYNEDGWTNHMRSWRQDPHPVGKTSFDYMYEVGSRAQWYEQTIVTYMRERKIESREMETD